MSYWDKGRLQKFIFNMIPILWQIFVEVCGHWHLKPVHSDVSELFALEDRGLFPSLYFFFWTRYFYKYA